MVRKGSLGSLQPRPKSRSLCVACRKREKDPGEEHCWACTIGRFQEFGKKERDHEEEHR